jgi:short-subunit dehydrogenase
LFDLKDKVIVLTGATGALGGALALSLAKSGAHLIILGRNQELLDKLISELTPFTKAQGFVGRCNE